MQEELSGNCNVAAVGSGFAVAKTVAAAAANERSWCPSGAHFSLLSGRGEYTDGISVSSLWALVLCFSCSEVCHWGSWGEVAIFQKENNTK